MMRTLFLNPPSYEGFDGGAGARYQARREIRSYWYPTWLAQPAAIVPGSLLVDAFYKRFYFRAGKLAEMSAELLRRPGMTTRRLREGGEFVRFLGRRTSTPAAG
jgi:hypothetical protein